MKKFIFFTALMFSVLLLGACTEQPMEADTHSMVINITNNSEFEFDAFEVNSELGDGGAANADGSKIKKGQTFSFEYTEADFPLVGEGDFEFSIKNEENITSFETLTLELKKNTTYTYEIIGDTMADAELKLVE